jgi:hypothetical protein
VLWTCCHPCQPFCSRYPPCPIPSKSK